MALKTNKALFLHIPKTGGVWMGHAMRRAGIEITQIGPQHIHFPQLTNADWEGQIKDKFVFAMIRHPLTWYQSRWAFRIKHGWSMIHPLDANCASNDFHTFVDLALKYKPDGWVTWLFEQYINNVPGGIDYVARLENCVEDAVELLTISGHKFDEEELRSTPRVNDSDIDGLSSKHWATYTPELMERVLAVESRVINRYYPNFEINPSTLCGPRPW
jgi:hypothetical protein